MAKSHDIHITDHIDATPDVVFDALTDPKKIEVWSGQKATLEAKVGGRFAMFDDWAFGKVIEYEPGRLLVVTWKEGEWPADSLVRYELTKKNGGTEIVLTHTNLPNAKEVKDHTEGWRDYVLEPLRDFLSRA